MHRVLQRVETSGGYVREALEMDDGFCELDERDSAFALRLALATTASCGVLDTFIDMLVDKPAKLDVGVRWALRLAVCEVLYLSAPAAVAVSQGVALVRTCAASAAGLANAVLRRAAERRKAFLAADDAPESKRPNVSVARRAGLPAWLVRRMQASLAPEPFERALACQLEPAPLWVQAHDAAARANGATACAGELDTVDTPPAGAVASALHGGRGLLAAFEPTQLPGCFRVLKPRELAAVRGGAMGSVAYAVSDFAAQLVAAAAVRPGSLLEVGAGRGTKSFTMSCMAERLGLAREHAAVDLSSRKSVLNAERLAAAGFDAVSCVSEDGCSLMSSCAPLGPGGTVCPADPCTLGERCRVGFDTVLLDAPCSGTGTMRRHPEIPWRLAPADIDPANPDGLPTLQLRLLKEASRAVARGGSLLYATCSVLAAENEQVVDAFLASGEGAGFSVERFSDAWAFAQEGWEQARAAAVSFESDRGFLRTAPAEGSCDGHFCARLVRKA